MVMVFVMVMMVSFLLVAIVVVLMLMLFYYNLPLFRLRDSVWKEHVSKLLLFVRLSILKWNLVFQTKDTMHADVKVSCSGLVSLIF